MKITKTNIDVANENKRKQIATQGCNICPCCGNKKDIYSFPFGVTNSMDKIIYYRCRKCGAEWESDRF